GVGLTLLILLTTFASLSAQSSHQHLRNGDAQYDLEHYKEAEKYYRDAADLKYGDPLAQYNLGNALYQQGNWEDAAVRFEQAAGATADATFKADALHNLGNAQLKQQKYKEAVESYEKSLRLRPGDAATKRNLQMAKKKLKEEQQRQKEEQQKQNQQQQNQNQQQPPQDPKNQQDQQQQDQNRQQDQPQQPNQGQPQQEQQPANNQQKLKKEEARRLLETAIGPEDQKNTRKYRELRQQPKGNGKEKDW
ncbi:MAG TPA: tetratricopeptide repeat protein, partial [Saprospiraceae bacterium]|nr:tetratricopeptide repeat protein [Saprospiraceae bacterium]